jgi:hypothetical protein
MKNNETIRREIDELIEQLKLRKSSGYGGFQGYVSLLHEAINGGIPVKWHGLKLIPPSDEIIKLLLSLRSRCHAAHCNM